MTAVIVDDEPACHLALKELLDLHHKEISIVGHAYGVTEGIQEIERCRPDLLFLDVEMDDGTGFDLLQNISDQQFAIIFITAHNKYALTAFRFNAIDYLLKPIATNELKDAIEGSRERLATMSWQENIREIRQMVHQIQQKQLPERLKIKTAGYTHLIPLTEVSHLEADQGYVEIHAGMEKRVVVSGNLIDYEKLLQLHKNFMRIHKSYILNLDYVRGWSDGQVTLSTGDILFVGRKYLPKWKAWLNSL